MKYKEFSEVLDYDKVTGITTNRLTKKVLCIQDDGYTIVVLAVDKTKKVKYNKVCYMMGNTCDLLEGYKILHRNLNTTDFRLCNLIQISSHDYKELRGALKNMQGGITVLPHDADVFTYRVTWYDRGVKKSRVLHDIVVAKRLELKLKLVYSKIISKFCLFEE